MADQIARLRVELLHIEPRIWRRVEVSVTTNLRALHELIQGVMPWENYHLYQFSIGERVYGEPSPEDAAWGHKVYHAKNMRLENPVRFRAPARCSSRSSGSRSGSSIGGSGPGGGRPWQAGGGRHARMHGRPVDGEVAVPNRRAPQGRGPLRG